MTPKSDEALKLWPAFHGNVSQRLDSGRRAYGDASFTREPDALLTEIQQELEDVAGWAFILWTRLEALRGRVVATPAGAEDYSGMARSAGK